MNKYTSIKPKSHNRWSAYCYRNTVREQLENSTEQDKLLYRLACITKRFQFGSNFQVSTRDQHMKETYVHENVDVRVVRQCSCTRKGKDIDKKKGVGQHDIASRS